ncbi:UNVERIFIED_CONTAM: multiple sugar transport system permease protein [Brevibacillus sp. OAP136]
MRKDLTEQQFAWLIIAPAIIIVFGIVIYPLVQTFLYSLEDIDLSAGKTGAFVGIANYVETLSDRAFWESLGRTAYFAAVSILLELVLGVFIALLLNEKFFGKTLLSGIVIIPWAVPTIVNAAMWKWIYQPEYGALNALLTQLHLIGEYKSWLGEPLLAMNMIILADVWKMTPLIVIFILAALQMVNKSVYEAAAVDGAGVIRRFFSITLHYLKPIFLVLVVIRTLEAIKVFDIIYATTRGGPANGTMVITFQAYLKAFNNLQFSKGATYSYLIALIILLLTVVYAKVLKRGEET